MSDEFLRVAADRIAPGSARIAGKNAIPRHQRRQLVLNHPDRREDGCHRRIARRAVSVRAGRFLWVIPIWIRLSSSSSCDRNSLLRCDCAGIRSRGKLALTPSLIRTSASPQIWSRFSAINRSISEPLWHFTATKRRLPLGSLGRTICWFDVPTMMQRRGSTSLFLRYASRMLPSSARLMNAFRVSIFACAMPAISDASTITYPSKLSTRSRALPLKLSPSEKYAASGSICLSNALFPIPCFPTRTKISSSLQPGNQVRWIAPIGMYRPAQRFSLVSSAPNRSIKRVSIRGFLSHAGRSASQYSKGSTRRSF